MEGDAISAVMPTHNRAHLIHHSISSCLDELDERDELIIVDDGSTDETEQVIQQFGDRVKYIRTPNRGAGAARNRGIREAKKPLLAFIDSDDEWNTGKIKIQRSFMKAVPDILYCFTNFSLKEVEALGGRETRFALATWSKDNRSWEEILGQGSPISSISNLPEGIDDFNYYQGSMYLLELSENYINVNTLIIRREQAGDALQFAEDTPTYEDWEFFGHISHKGIGAYLDIETACQNSHGGPRLTDSHVTVCAETRVKIIERIWGKDADFLKEHESLYKEVLDKQRLLWAEGLIVQGEIKRAREQIRLLSKPPFVHTIISKLPRSIVRSLLKAYRSLKR
jgi:glycosyltransferase involved in cell wall biosynthesis